MRKPMNKLSRLINPRHIAFVGGAQIAGPVRACQRAGYAGEIFVVNPFHAEIEGVECMPRIEQLPFAPDAALVGLSAERSIEAIAALSDRKAGGAVIISSGFAELGEDGASRQAALVAAAGDMALLGPNCMGVLNQFEGAAIWGDDNHIERQEGPAAAIISQSGALLIGMTNVEQAFPLGYAISTGNQAVTGMAECLDAVLEDDRIKAIGLYLEGMDDGEALGRACLAAFNKNVPIVALKGGDQQAGAEVALSHTASMIVERHMWEAFCDRFAVVEVSSPKALVETLKLLTIGGVPAGNNVSIISYSGGLNGLAATRAGTLGLNLPSPTDGNRQYLQNSLPETVAIANPLDLNIPFQSKTGISLSDRAGVARAIEAFAGEVSDQIIFFIDVPRPGAGNLDKVWQDSLEAMIDVTEKLKVPCNVAGILPEGLGAEFRSHLMRNGVAALSGFCEAMEALSVSVKIAKIRRQRAGITAPAPLYTGRANCGGVMLDEAQSKAELARHGLVSPVREVVKIEEAGATGARLGFPVVLKVLSNTIAHKARVGGVRLGLCTPDEVEAAARQMAQQVCAAEDGHTVLRVLVEKMIANVETEIIIGIKSHPALGLAMLIGRGGGDVEANSSFETLLLPPDGANLAMAIGRLGVKHHQALAKAAHAIAAYADAARDRLVTLDVNPLILTSHGEAIAADALVVLAAKGD